MIQLTIYVNDIDTVMATFTHIKIYTSTTEDGTYTALTTISLVADQSSYTYIHTIGMASAWYKSSYWSASVESSLSDAVQGTSAELYHYPTYPEELAFDRADQIIIRKIRRYIGDLKGLSRLYQENCANDSCVYIANDNRTINLETNGWPVYVAVTTVSGIVEEKTLASDPVVQGYKYLTFTDDLINTSGVCQFDTIDIWYYTFKFSDREIYEAYNDAFLPPNVPAASVTSDHLILQAAISLLENMSVDDMINDGAVIYDDASKYDPSPGLAERDKTIKRLRKMLDDLIDETKRNLIMNLTGVLID